MKKYLITISLFFLVCSLSAANWDGLSDKFRNSMDLVDVKNARLNIYRLDGTLLFSDEVGSFSTTETIPILSASKWISAATFLTLVDYGFYKLDDPIMLYIDNLPNHLNFVTIRHLLSFTSGTPSRETCMHSPYVTLEECAYTIIDLTENDIEPGKKFVYGDAYFTLLGLVAQNATKLSWQEIFDVYMKEPMGFESEGLFYAKPRKLKGKQNPRPAAGLRISFGDYEKFLRMIASGGIYNGQKILSKHLIEEMELDQVAIAAQLGGYTYPGYISTVSYGFGNYLYCFDIGCKNYVNTSPGLNGFTPWIDREKGYYAILGIFEPRNMFTVIQPIQRALIKYIRKIDF